MNNAVNVRELERFIEENEKDVEPAVRKAVGGALAIAVAAIFAAVGMEINDVTAPWVNVLIAFLGPIGTGFMIRKGVISPNTAKLLQNYYKQGRVPGNDESGQSN